jgi:hypothetical protein
VKGATALHGVTPSAFREDALAFRALAAVVGFPLLVFLQSFLELLLALSCLHQMHL